MAPRRPLLAVCGVSKRYPGVQALDRVEVAVLAGEVHALVGENGAGKSTLIKILSGATPPDEGVVVFDGEEYSSLTPVVARHLGISVIHQEFNLISEMTVAENMFLGTEGRNRLGLLKKGEMLDRAAQQIRALGRDIDVQSRIVDLTVAEQQLVEIARALLFRSRLVVMDEPSAVLAGEELEHLMAVVRHLRDDGVAVIYVSHRLDEVFDISDRVTVLKDGKLVDTRATAELDRDTLVRLMVGRPIESTFPPPATSSGRVTVQIRDLAVRGALSGVDLDVHAGEVLGIGGLGGSGRTSLAHALFGVVKHTGSVRVEGRSLPRRRSPARAIKSGMTFVPEDRRQAGLFLGRSVKFNLALPNLTAVAPGGVVKPARLDSTVRRLMAAVRLRPADIGRDVAFLSGGNQQKVVLGKWLASTPKFAILDEPTRGVDVGAKAEIYQQIRALAESGTAVMMLSSDMVELLGMSDRIAVLREGELAGILSRDEADEEAVMRLATPGAASTLDDSFPEARE